VNFTAADFGHEIALSVIIGGIVAFARMIVWLIGLVIAIRGSRAKDRADVLHAYSTFRDSQRLVNLVQPRARLEKGEPISRRRRSTGSAADTRSWPPFMSRGELWRRRLVGGRFGLWLVRRAGIRG
jgi:hypothetical protein